MGQGAQGIYGLLASNPGVLNARSRRLPDGFYLVEVAMTKEGPANARSGACFIIEFVAVSAGVNGDNSLRGQKFSTVPKLDKNPEAATRELVQFVASCEGKTLDDYTDAATKAVDGKLLAMLIQRTFQATSGVGANAQPANPYRGVRLFVRAENKRTEGGFDYVKHEWSPATQTLAGQLGYDWPSGSVEGSAAPAPAPTVQAPPMVPAVPGLPGFPAAPSAPAIPPAAPMVAPMVPAPAMAPQAPPAPMVAPAPVPPPAPAIPAGPRAVEGQPGWFYSVRFPGFYFSGPSEEAPSAYYNPADGSLTRY